MGISLCKKCFEPNKNENESRNEKINPEYPSSTINNIKQNEIKKEIIPQNSNNKIDNSIYPNIIICYKEIQLDIINEIKPKNIKNNADMKEENIFSNEFELYGFINDGNNCYLNSSLQLLTRINEMKNKIINYKGNINTDSITKGKLFKEFKNILENISNGKNSINPKGLKNVMGKIDERYYQNNQEDANEFISNFLEGLLDEIGDKNSLPERLNITNEEELKSYNKFYNKFYKSKGNSFLLDLFYVIIKNQKICKDCKKLIIKFNAYNIIELPIYEFAKKNKNKDLDFVEILKKFKEEKKDGECIYCHSNNIYESTNFYKLSKYLIFYFGRTIDNEYINNNIIYPEKYNFEIFQNFKYKLECVIEHFGYAHSGHYTSLCNLSGEKKLYKFNDISFYPNDSQFHGDNAIILLYKKID